VGVTFVHLLRRNLNFRNIFKVIALVSLDFWCHLRLIVLLRQWSSEHQGTVMYIVRLDIVVQHLIITESGNLFYSLCYCTDRQIINNIHDVILVSHRTKLSRPSNSELYFLVPKPNYVSFFVMAVMDQLSYIAWKWRIIYHLHTVWKQKLLGQCSLSHFD
jgi:hypothetical protein